MGEQNRNETVFFGLPDKHGIGHGENRGDVVVGLREHSQDHVRGGHDKGRTKAMSRHVSNRDPKPTVRHGQIVEVVSCGELGGMQYTRDFERGRCGAARGKSPC